MDNSALRDRKTTYDRVYNFSAGPSVLPLPVLEQIKEELFNWNGSGLSVMEMSHRSKEFDQILFETEDRLRKVLGISDDSKVLFLQGGASMQSTMIPMNLLKEGETADYVITGVWSKKSLEAAEFEGSTNVAYDGKSHRYSRCPDLESLSYSNSPAYIHYTSNETIQGVEFPGDASLAHPVVCDMSSNILSKPIDLSRYDLIYAGAQKTMGPAGVTIVILKNELLERASSHLPPMLSYKTQAENGSRYNTPPCWSIYVCGLVYQWLLDLGGLEAMYARNKKKAQIIYDVIDGSEGFYKGHAEVPFRSMMNITFTLKNDSLTPKFIQEAEASLFNGIEGHRLVGGCRLSIYNAFPKEGCNLVAQFMKEFAERNG